MKILKTIVFHGPNRWSTAPVLEAHIEIDPTTDRSANELSDTVNELHRMAGISTEEFPPVVVQKETIFLLPFAFEEEALLRECLDSAIRLCQATQRGEAIDTESQRRRLVDLADDIRLGPSSLAILRAAASRGIPYHRLTRGSLVQLGEGTYQRRIWTAETDATSAIAESIAGDKQLTRSMLASVGVNVPRGRQVSSRDDAWQAAQEIGLPVAVKPRNGNHANGVSLDLSDRESILVAYDWASQSGTTEDVLVEQYIVGDHHRLLVIGGKLVAAARGQRDYVFGDGVRSITELINELNSDPLRGENYTDTLDTVKFNEATSIILSKQGLTFDSIPKANQQVLVRHVGDLIEDCTDEVHPSTRREAILAAKTVGLDIAGMDLVAKDISKPLNEQRGCIIEVNAGPSLGFHVAPLIGSPQPVGEAIVDLLFKPNSKSTIPTILVVTQQCESSISLSIASKLTKAGFEVGMASEFRVSKNKDIETSESISIVRPLKQFRDLLLHPFISAVVVECSAKRIAEEGLPCSHAEFVVVPESLFLEADATNPDSDIFATLKTLELLLANQGLLIILGGSQGTRKHVEPFFSKIASRVQYASSEEQILNLIQTSTP